MEIIRKYFPNLTQAQFDQLAQLGALYREWNEKINVISRKDIDNLYERHVLHALAIYKVVQFLPKAEILDIGTGGGFPGIPLAIVMPEVSFTLIDGTRKKITVVQEIKTALGLKNVIAKQIRAEEVKHHFDFVVCRAVASLDKLCNWSFPLIKNKQKHPLPNGLLTLKGGDVSEEIKARKNREYIEQYPLAGFFEEEFFETKQLIYVQG
ncbi:MAG: 16S rRNA (guanine(527)-N(7))-methyltransferase RsmG [Saprospiraceae bacterium]